MERLRYILFLQAGAMEFHASRMLLGILWVWFDHGKSNGSLCGHSCGCLGKNVGAGHGTICAVITRERVGQSQQPLRTRA